MKLCIRLYYGIGHLIVHKVEYLKRRRGHLPGAEAGNYLE